MVVYPHKQPKLGKEILMPTTDDLRLLKGQWYSNFRARVEWGIGTDKIQVGLGVYGDNKNKIPCEAIIELGKVIAEAQKGIRPGGARRKIAKIKIKGPLKGRYQQILDQWIYPFFGEYRPRDLTTEIMESYLKFRWGFNENNELQAVENTWSKELYILNKLIREVLPNYSAPKVEYIKLEKEILPPLTMFQIKETAKKVIKKYRAVYWVMAYTAMDISDVLDLKPEHIADGMIIKPRGKTNEKIAVPICPSLDKIMKGLPLPLGKSIPYFQNYSSKNISTDVRKAFKQSGLPGYGAKYLRRYVASALLDGGLAMEWIAQVLGHADKSPLTQKYTGIYKKTLKEAFSKIG